MAANTALEMQYDFERLFALWLAWRMRRGIKQPRRREWYELGFRDGWEAANTGQTPEKEIKRFQSIEQH